MRQASVCYVRRKELQGANLPKRTDSAQRAVIDRNNVEDDQPYVVEEINSEIFQQPVWDFACLPLVVGWRFDTMKVVENVSAEVSYPCNRMGLFSGAVE